MVKPKSKKSKKKVAGPKAVVTFKKNFLPPIIGILVMVVVLGLLNAQWLSAQLEYRFYEPPASIALPAVPTNQIDTRSPNPNGPPELAIGSIGVKAPIIFDEPSYAEPKVQLALRKGVLRFGPAPEPGNNGNMVIVGHSSGQIWAPGDYKFIFTHLDKVKPGDIITIDYKAIRYSYKVEGTEVIAPTDVRVLEPTEQPTLTLITCTPVGTSKNRLVVRAKQIAPDPKLNTAGAVDAPAISPKLPDSANSSFWENLFN